MTFDDQRGADPGDDPRPIVLDLEPRAPRPPLVHVRRWVVAALAGLDDDHVHAAMQVATELVTNAYQHGGGTRQVRLAFHRWPCWVRIEVDDVATRDGAFGGVARLETHGGRGLVIVDEFASDWGVSAWIEGKTVWARIDCEDTPRVTPCAEGLPE